VFALPDESVGIVWDLDRNFDRSIGPVDRPKVTKARNRCGEIRGAAASRRCLQLASEISDGDDFGGSPGHQSGDDRRLAFRRASDAGRSKDQ
jgi:hypothetical protein